MVYWEKVLACIGCWVPAQEATVRVPDRIYTRLSSQESFEANASTFMSEMQETRSILDGATARSLVLIDGAACFKNFIAIVALPLFLTQGCLVVLSEIGRATSNVDGTAIAWCVPSQTERRRETKKIGYFFFFSGLCRRRSSIVDVSQFVRPTWTSCPTYPGCMLARGRVRGILSSFPFSTSN